MVADNRRREDDLPFENIHELLPTPPHRQPDWVAWLGLSPWIRTPIKAPSFVLGDCPAALSAYYHDHIGEADTGVYRLRNTGVTGSGMIVRDDMLVASNHLGHSVDYCRGQVSSGRIKSPESYTRRNVDSAVLLLGGGYDIYGHWLVDIMPKLFALSLVGLDVSSLSFLIPSDTEKFGHAWLELAGIRPDQLLVYDPQSEIVVAEDLIVPVLLRSGSRASALFKGAVSFLLDVIDRRQEPPKRIGGWPKSIFVSRARANRDGRSVRNREEVEAVAVDQGYTLVYPERLPIIEQIAMFRNAERIVGEYGSGLHSSMFSPAGALVCCLRGAARHPGFLQSGLAQALDQECGYVLGEASIDAIQFKFDIDLIWLRKGLLLLSLPRR